MVVQGFLEPSSGDTKSCQLVGWDVSSMGDWRMTNPNTVPANLDLNMDSIYCIPQLAGGNFAYTRLPHVTHGVFASAPVQGTYAVPQEPSDLLIDQLRAQALSQFRLYGSASSAVAFAPPPPARGRSRARAQSAPRAAPPPGPAATLTPVPSNLGATICPDCGAGRGKGSRLTSFCSDIFTSPLRDKLPLLFWPNNVVLASQLNVVIASPRRKLNKIKPADNGGLIASWEIL